MTATMASQTLSDRDYRQQVWPSPGTAWSEETVLRVPAHLAVVVERMNALLNLDPGWNSYAAKRIDGRAVVLALRFLADSGWGGPSPTINPTPEGGVQLQWGGDDDGVEVWFDADGTMGALVDADGDMTEYRIKGLWDPAVSDVLAWAYKLG